MGPRILRLVAFHDKKGGTFSKSDAYSTIKVKEEGFGF